MQNVQYIMRCTFLYFVESFHFSLTPQKGNQRENHDLTRTLLSRRPLTQIQYYNHKALAFVPLQPMDPCLTIYGHHQHITVGPLPWYHYGPCDPALASHDYPQQARVSCFFITSHITFSCMHIHTFTMPCL